jgi:hypothetical protein
MTVEAVKTEILEWDFVDRHGTDILSAIQEANDRLKEEQQRKLQEQRAPVPSQDTEKPATTV